MDDGEIELSIVVLAFNHEKYIRHALDSILDQRTSYRYEVLIGDDCSLDKTPSIVKEYEKNWPDIVSAYCREHNLGGVRNSVDLTEKCKGRYIAFLDGDDFYTDDSKLQTQISFLEENPKYFSCAHRLEIVDKEEKHLLYTLSDLELNRPMTGKDYSRYGTDMIHPSSLMMRNIFKSNSDVIDFLRNSNTLSLHSPKLLLCLRESPIYVFERPMTAWRSVKEIGATNYTSQAYAHQAEFNEEKLALYKAEKIYFGNSVPGVDLSCQLAKGFLRACDALEGLYSADKKKWKRKYRDYLGPHEYLLSLPRVRLDDAFRGIKTWLRKRI